MGEIAQTLEMMSKGFSTAVHKYPSGRYGIVGSVPYELTKPRGGLFPGRDSMVWETEQEVIDALLEIGITHFQIADCSWYPQS